MNHHEAVRSQFRTQAGWCAELGSPIGGHICAALADLLSEDTETGRRLLNWQGDIVKDAFTLRLLGGLHALARAGHEPSLTAIFAGERDDYTAVLSDILARHDAQLARWLDSPPQTNEVGRAGVLWAGLMWIVALHNLPIELLELGSSAGLNLNLDKFYYDLGGVRSGETISNVKIAPIWTGAAPPLAHPVITSRRGVDQAPVDLTDTAAAERLMAFIWVGQIERLKRTEAAIALAQMYPPPIDNADIVPWLRTHLALPQAEGCSRVVMHSITLQYLTPEGRAEVAAMMAEAGARASETAPLAWVAMESERAMHAPELHVTIWPGGARTKLADVHPHGTTINWVG